MHSNLVWKMSIYKLSKSIFESVSKDNSRLNIGMTFNFWPHITVYTSRENDLVRWIFMVVRHSSCNALRGTIVLLRQESLKYCLVVYFTKVDDFAPPRRGATPFRTRSNFTFILFFLWVSMMRLKKNKRLSCICL